MKTTSSNPVSDLFKWGFVLAFVSAATITLMAIGLGIS